ncbi:type IA DNA topoisomerase [Jeotgalibacillus sp. R-1-5s-1]|uniref:type IA DNA topoisomerase n=1 Tax=Jeotgalibacillus sp. R-1-5s-1 TaxID=2555897 RepID=UPI001068FA1E|nr:type IA DNA topoisomerase [Jeotgalibacillus sp. R-1-5s-1]TFD98157.1 type IA DNA topoisomerase [Jeotgalibacillus sp. R-1-5s-1]
MYTVILAEKPSQAKSYADAFSSAQKSNGYYEISDPLFPGGAAITWGFGHLVSLEEPHAYKKEWKRWRLDLLPIIPDEFKFTVPYAKRAQFNIIKGLLRKANQIIVATDSDREGENIARSIIEQANMMHKPTKRLWINSLEKDVIRRGFQELRDGEDYLPLYDEAQTRQLSDWLVGMNMSRLYTLLLQEKGIDGPFSVGRVQTPTLYMIWQRQHEIENFKPEPFFQLLADHQAKDINFQTKHKESFKTSEEAAQILQKHYIEEGKTLNGTVSKAEKKQKKMQAPSLHSLSTLQAKLNRRFKYSPSNVLKTVQDLYEKKLVSYPRTDCPFITRNEFNYLAAQVEKMKESVGASFDVKHPRPRPKYVQDQKVQEHYAIIPTRKLLTKDRLEKLKPMERNVYEEIVNSTLAMFHEDYHYEETVIEVDINGLLFTAKGTVEKIRGWKELFNETNKKDAILPNVTVGDMLPSKVNVKEDVTKPPKPYTEGQLILMMKTAGKLLEDEQDQAVLKEVEGIGTEATRASIIDTLKKQKYITITKNNVSVTDKGVTLCKVIEGTLLSSPEMTAKWEAYLKKIGRRQGNQEAFLKNIGSFIEHMMQTAPEKIGAIPKGQGGTGTKKRSSSLADCPSCKKGKMVDKGGFYGCNEYKNGCRQTLPKILLSKKLSDAQIKALCEKGQTALLKGFKSKNGKTFSARLVLKDGKIEMEFK